MKSSHPVDLLRPQSKHAVHRLLQLAQNKLSVQDHWHACINLENHNLRKDRSKMQQTRNTRVRQNIQRRKIDADKPQLKVLFDQTINQQDKEMPVQLRSCAGQVKKQQRLDFTLKLIKNTKLRPFNSNMTFYNLKKQVKSKFANTSLSFYEPSSKANPHSLKEKKSQAIFSSKEIQQYQQTGQFYKDKPSKSLVYFTSNKSQTVRQLLNRMSVERKRGSNILLHSTQRDINPQIQSEECAEQENFVSQHQLKQINKYSKFFPFRKDQQLLYRKISEVDSIWLNKFKESWNRSKQNRDSRGRYLKKLIVN